jgi:hypothetical protein
MEILNIWRKLGPFDVDKRYLTKNKCDVIDDFNQSFYGQINDEELKDGIGKFFDKESRVYYEGCFKEDFYDGYGRLIFGDD